MKPEPREIIERARFALLLEAYGADAEHWPEDERAAALALVQRDPDARVQRAEAARLDALLGLVEPTAPSPALIARILAAAPAPAGSARRPLSFLRPAIRNWRYAAALPLAAAAALTLWLVRTPAPIAQPSPVSLAQLGTYETPGDELLGLSEVELFNTDPWSDCPDALLGCLDADPVADDPQSRSAYEIGDYA